MAANTKQSSNRWEPAVLPGAISREVMQLPALCLNPNPQTNGFYEKKWGEVKAPSPGGTKPFPNPSPPPANPTHSLPPSNPASRTTDRGRNTKSRPGKPGAGFMGTAAQKMTRSGPRTTKRMRIRICQLAAYYQSANL